MKDGNEWVLVARKLTFRTAAWPSFYVTFARTAEGRRRAPVATHCRSRGCRPRRPLARLTYDNVRVPATRSIGEPGEGFRRRSGDLEPVPGHGRGPRSIRPARARRGFELCQRPPGSAAARSPTRCGDAGEAGGHGARGVDASSCLSRRRAAAGVWGAMDDKAMAKLHATKKSTTGKTTRH